MLKIEIYNNRLEILRSWFSSITPLLVASIFFTTQKYLNRRNLLVNMLGYRMLLMFGFSLFQTLVQWETVVKNEANLCNYFWIWAFIYLVSLWLYKNLKKQNKKYLIFRSFFGGNSIDLHEVLRVTLYYLTFLSPFFFVKLTKNKMATKGGLYGECRSSSSFGVCNDEYRHRLKYY